MRHALVAAAVVLAAGCRPATSPDQPPPTLQFGLSQWWPDTSGYAGVGDGKLLITNTRDDTLSLFELASVATGLQEVSRPNVGFSPVDIEGPHHAAIHPSGAYFYVGLSMFAPGTASGPHGAHGTGTADGSVLKIRSSDNVRVASARVDRNPGDLVLSPDGTTLAVSHYDLVKVSEALRKGTNPDARVLLLDSDTLEVKQRIVVCPAPHGLGFSPDGQRLYASCLSDELAVVQLGDGTVTRVKVAANGGDAFSPRYQPYGVAVSPATGDAWVTCQATGEARVLSAQTLAMDDARAARVGGRPVMPSFSAAGDRLWVPHQLDNRVSEVDPTTGQQRRALALPSSCINAHHVIEAPGGAQLLVVCEGDGTGPGRLVALDAATGAVLSDAATGAYPDYVGVLRTK